MQEDKGQRRRRLTDRLNILRDRIRFIEQELLEYTNDFYRVCIFGSARIKQDDELYKITEELAHLLGHQGIDVLTGGGPGLMEAANKGLTEGRNETRSKSKSFGLSIQGGIEAKHTNMHLDIKQHHRTFSTRLDDFMRLSNAVVVMPGGIGTLLELYFFWQLLQIGHLTSRPIILIHAKFWQGLLDWMRKQQIDRGLVGPTDMRWIHVVETPAEALAIIKVEHQKFLDRKEAIT
ncbi:TIGR00730 family Rossman fold protein [bacterium]|nr:TIGR00730 family Rossman fold protein [bacterium]